MRAEDLAGRSSRRAALVRRWRSLSRSQRALVAGAAAIDTTGKVIALIDLARRPAEQLRGPKWAWAIALPTVNSAGVLPLAYFLLGRRRP